MIENFPMLTLLILLPILSLLPMLIIGNDKNKSRIAQQAGLWISCINFILSCSLLYFFDFSIEGYQFKEQVEILSNPKISYSLGIDGISIFFILLTTALTPLCIVASWNRIKTYPVFYVACFMALESILIGVFAATDLVLFYIFFEASLIPMFIIIGIWGDKDRIYAAFKFFLYTFFGSVFMLIALVFIILETGTSSFDYINTYIFSDRLQILLWLGFFFAFAVKIPMWPVHTWLPDAHVQAPTTGSVILAALLLKLGGYGFIRVTIPWFPEGFAVFGNFVVVISIIAAIYTSFVALAQTDIKKLIAYSSVAHMAFVTAGIATMNEIAINGAILQMLGHGVVSAALFLVVGMIYNRMHTKKIAEYSGLVHSMPVYAFFFMLFMLASVGLPGTSGFIGEFLVLVGVFEYNIIFAFLLASVMVLGAAYMLYLYRRIIFGLARVDKLTIMTDLSLYEVIVLAPLVVLTFWLGIYPFYFTKFITPAVSNLLSL